MTADDNFEDLLQQPPRVPDWISKRGDILTDFAANELPQALEIEVVTEVR